MKKTALIAAVLLGSAALSSVLAQGTIQWGNFFTATHAPIYGVDPANPLQTRTGNPPGPMGIPAGTTVYGGSLLAGTGFTVALYVGSSATEVMAQMTHLQSQGFRTGPGAGYTAANLTATDPTRPPGTLGVNVQFRAWDNQMGTITSWAQVLARQGNVAGGQSDVFTVGALGGSVPPDIFLPPATLGIRSFQLTAVPEPSLIALGALGLGALLLRRRK
jgi:hypothetical protein